MESIVSAAPQAIKLEDGTANYMGDGCWVLERHEAAQRGTRRHTFGITEEDRQALLAPEGALTVHLEDGLGHHMGDGCWVLTRSERLGLRSVSQAIGVTTRDLARLGAVEWKCGPQSGQRQAEEGASTPP